jgi:hypothetical protein
VLQYEAVVRDPVSAAHAINLFAGGALDEARMAAAVDPTLYRNRSPR